MGKYLSKLKSIKKNIDLPYVQLSAIKLRQQYSSFRLICDTFSIDTAEYSQIFGADTMLFEAWDTERTGRIDGIQLFTGIVLFSLAKFQQKMQFLFEIFDLNEEGELGFDALHFMLVNAVSATNKIYCQSQQEVDEQELEDFLSGYFYQETRLTLPAMTIWASKVDEIRQYFTSIGKDAPVSVYKVPKRPNKSNKHAEYSIVSARNPPDFTAYSNKKQISLDYCSHLNSILKHGEDNNGYYYNYKLEWVFGIRINDVRSPVSSLCSVHEKAANQKIIYFVGCVAIVYYPKLNVQKHYIKHTSEIGCMAVGVSKQGIIATGQINEDPSIHVWSLRDMQTIKILRSSHRSSISHLVLFDKDRYLASCSQKQDLSYALVIHSVKKGQVIHSTIISQKIVTIFRVCDSVGKQKQKSVHNSVYKKDQVSWMPEGKDKRLNKMATEQPEKQLVLNNYISSFIIACTDSLIYFTYQKNSKGLGGIYHLEQELRHKQITELTYAVTGEQFGDGFYVHTGHLNGSIYKWHFSTVYKPLSPNALNGIDKVQKQALLTLDSYIEADEKCQPVLSICIVKNEMYVLNAQNSIQKIDTKRLTKIKRIQIDESHYSGPLIQLIPYSQNSFLALSAYGDLLQLDPSAQQSSPKNHIYQLFKMDEIKASILAEDEDKNTDLMLSSIPDHHNCILYVCSKDEVFRIDIADKEVKSQFQLNSVSNTSNTINSQPSITAIAISGHLQIYGLSNGEVREYDRRSTSKILLAKEPIRDLIVDEAERLFVLTAHEIYLVFKSSRTYCSDSQTLIQQSLYSDIEYFTICCTSRPGHMLIAAEGSRYFILQASENSKMMYEIEASEIHGNNSMQNSNNLGQFMDSKKMNPIFNSTGSDKRSKLNKIEVNKKWIKARGGSANSPITANSEAIITSTPEGEIVFWAYDQQVGQDNFAQKIKVHGSAIQNIIGVQKGFYSIGATDQMICYWSLDTIVKKPNTTLALGHTTASKISTLGQLSKMPHQPILFIKEEIERFSRIEPRENVLTDSQMQISNMVDKNLDKIIQKILLHEQTTRSKKSLSSQNLNMTLQPGKKPVGLDLMVNTELKKQLNWALMSTAPPLLLTLHQIYGFECASLRNTVMYCHKYPPQTSKYTSFSSEVGGSLKIASQTRTDLGFAQQPLPSYTESHTHCDRYLLFFSERVIIKFCPVTRKQQFYDSHIGQILCLAIHPNKNVACSAEVVSQAQECNYKTEEESAQSIQTEKEMQINKQAKDKKKIDKKTYSSGKVTSRSVLHVWDTTNMSQILKYKFTSMIGAVRHLTFSRDGRYILGLFYHQGFSGVEIYDWENRMPVASRWLCPELILQVSFNPLNRHEFAVVGQGTINIYRIERGSIILGGSGFSDPSNSGPMTKYTTNMSDSDKDSNRPESHKEKAVITSMAYICNSYGDLQESDILNGDSKGNIGLFMCGKFMIVKQLAHDKAITCLKVCELFKAKTVLISAAEDGKIKIWDTNMDLLKEIHVATLNCIQKTMTGVGRGLNFAVQSIDIFHCEGDKRDLNQQFHTLLLFATRNGFIFEASVRNQYKGLKMNSSTSSLQLTFNIQFSSIHTSLKAEEPVSIQTSKRFASKKNQIDHMSILASSRTDELCLRKNTFVVHGRYLVTFSTRLILFWDAQKISPLKAELCPQDPVYGVFSPSGEFFLLGTMQGSVLIYEVSQNTISVVEKLIHEQMCVVTIRFADSGTKLAVSLTPTKDSSQKQSTVRVYSIEGRKESSATRNRDPKIQSVGCIVNKNAPPGSTVVSMDFSTSEGQNYLLMHYRNIKDRDRTAIQQTSDGKVAIWNIEKNEIHKPFDNLDFNSINFAQLINIKYKLFGKAVNEKANISVSESFIKASITQMTQFQDIIILGTTRGQIVATRGNSFFVDPDTSAERISQARTQNAHSNPIESMYVVGNSLYTSSSKGTTIMKWKLQLQQEPMVLDPVAHLIYEQDNGAASVKHLLETVFPKRKNCSDIMNSSQQNQVENKPRIQLKLRNSFGRSAIWKKNNIYCNFNGTLITHSGCNLVLLNNSPAGIQQQFIKLDNSSHSIVPEISTICLSEDKKVLVAGTRQEFARVLVWDFGTRTTTQNIQLGNIIEVKCIRISYCKTKLVLTALTNKANLVLIYLDVLSKQIKAFQNFEPNNNYLIRDIQFKPYQHSHFATCGDRHLSIWRQSCGKLLPSSLNNVPYVRLESLIYVSGMIVTAGSDGVLYLWEDHNLSSKQTAHPEACILTLFGWGCDDNSRKFASGGTDGKVVLWRITNSKSLEKLYECNVVSSLYFDEPRFVKNHVQAITIFGREIYAGTRSGAIYVCVYDEKQNNNIQLQKLVAKSLSSEELEILRPRDFNNAKHNSNNKLMLPAFDDQSICSVCFTPDSSSILVLTKEGTLSKLNINTLKCEFTIKMSEGSKPLRMFVCRHSPKLYIVFSEQIICYSNIAGRFHHQPEYSNNSLNKLQVIYRRGTIDHAILSPDEKTFAILKAGNSGEVPKLIVVDLEKKAGSEMQKNQAAQVNLINNCGLKERILKENLAAKQKIVDFSQDSVYLWIQNDSDEGFSKDTYFNMIDGNQTKSISHTIQWSSEFQNLKRQGSGFHQAEHAQLIKADKIRDKDIVGIDEMGAVRVFGINENDRYAIYLQHLSDPTVCVVSLNGNVLVTGGGFDKALHIWDIIE